MSDRATSGFSRGGALCGGLLLLPLAWLAGGCITTPAYETGWTGRARELTPPSCGDAALIEDADDGDGRGLVREGRGGYWFVFTDSEGSTIDPPPGPFKMTGAGRNGSKHAARIHGQLAGSGQSTYAGMGLSLADPRGAYDASRYTGVSFWAKGPGHVRLEIPDGYTAPEGQQCKDCYNDFGIELALTSEWDQYTVPFEWLSQRQGWGDPRPEIAADKLFAIEWQVGTPGKSYDISIDDVSFVCGSKAAP